MANLMLLLSAKQQRTLTALLEEMRQQGVPFIDHFKSKWNSSLVRSVYSSKHLIASSKRESVGRCFLYIREADEMIVRLLCQDVEVEAIRRVKNR